MKYTEFLIVCEKLLFRKYFKKYLKFKKYQQFFKPENKPEQSPNYPNPKNLENLKPEPPTRARMFKGQARPGPMN